MKKTYPYSKTVEGFTLSLHARHLSPHTIEHYTRTLAKFGAYLQDDLPINEIDHRHIQNFLAAQTTVTNKTLLGHYIALSSFWSWLVKEELVPANVVRKVTPPKAEKKEVAPFTHDEVKALFNVLNKSRIYTKHGKPSDHTLGSFERNRAILLLMLDTGIRAQELCDLKIEDVDNRNNRIYVRMGKGMKERMLPFSPRTGQMIWRYLASRKDTRPEDPLFLSRIGRPMTRTKLAEMISNIGKRAGVPNVHPHKFRHTFAIEYLRNGGNAFTLQMSLGHQTLDMVRRYLQIAQVDMDSVHKRASPVEAWRL